MAHNMYTDTLAILELSSRICSERSTNFINPEVILQQFKIIEKLQLKLRNSSQDIHRLCEMNKRLTRQIGNYEQTLSESNETVRQLKSELAAANATNEGLIAELEEYRHIIGCAKDELKNVTIRKPTLQQQNDDLFLSGDKTMQSIYYQHNNGKKTPPKRRSSSHHQMLSRKRSRSTFNEQVAPYRTPLTAAPTYRPPLSTSREDENRRERDCFMQSLAPIPIHRTPLTASAIDGKRLPVRLARRQAVAPTDGTRITTAQHSQPPASAPAMRRRRSISEPGLFAGTKMPAGGATVVAGAKKITPTQRHRFRSRTPKSNGRQNKLPGFGPGWTRGRPINSCEHQFVEERALGKMLQNCKMCENRLGLSFHRCKDCKLCVHFNCRFLAPLPCVPFVVPPSKSGVQKFRLADYCPTTNPKVPAQLIRCVYAIESNQKNGVEVYEHAKPAWSDPTILALFGDFERLGSSTVLTGFQPWTLTGFIKAFLQELKEPLIPISSYNEFLHAARCNDQKLLRNAVDDLFPLPNRDTLAYLCLHWQQMISRENRDAVYVNSSDQPDQQITRRLAIALAPTVCSTMPKHSEDVLRKALQMENVGIPTEEHEKVIIMEQLLRFGDWSQILLKCCTSEMPTNIVPMPSEMPKPNHNQLAPEKSSSNENNSTASKALDEFSADSSILGPVTWTPVTPQQMHEQRNRHLINRVPRTAGPIFDRPY